MWLHVFLPPVVHKTVQVNTLTTYIVNEVSPIGIGLFLLIKDRGEELVALVKFLFRYNEPATLMIENPKLSVPTVHEDEYCSRPRILMKHIAYVVDQRVPLVAETHVAFAVFVAHS